MILEYQHFRAQVRYIATARCYYGEISVGEDIICFQATNRNEIESAMHQAVDQFLAQHVDPVLS